MQEEKVLTPTPLGGDELLGMLAALANPIRLDKISRSWRTDATTSAI